jgi:putative thiamine transport system substrate-binding protein
MSKHWSRRSVIAAGAAIAGLPALGRVQAAEARQLNWEGIQALAKGQTVHFNAWGGDQRINDYIAWAGSEVTARAGVEATSASTTTSPGQAAR